MMKTLTIGLGLVGLFMVTGCASYVDLQNGRALMTEQRSPFGTNGGFMQMQECDKTVDPNSKLVVYEHNCIAKSEWIPVYSQGQGGQILGGALTGLGFGLGSVFSGASGASASSTSSSIATGGKGH
jgi:uncharacterized membrane protein YedE/YeeE